MIIVLTVTAIIVGHFPEKTSGALFEEFIEFNPFNPHIKRLSDKYFVSMDVMSSGNYFPYDIATRADFAKIITYTRLAEEFGIKDEWNKKSKLGMALEILNLLQKSFDCKKGACASIGGIPFTDVPESDPKCMVGKLWWKCVCFAFI